PRPNGRLKRQTCFLGHLFERFVAWEYLSKGLQDEIRIRREIGMPDFFVAPAEADDVADETEVERDDFVAAMKTEAQIKLRPTSAVAGFPIVRFPVQQKTTQRRGRFRRYADKSGF